MVSPTRLVVVERNGAWMRGLDQTISSEDKDKHIPIKLHAIQAGTHLHIDRDVGKYDHAVASLLG